MASPPFLIKSAGATDVGRRRQVNQDCFLCDDELGLWIVADGMGGHAAGEVASHEAVDAAFGMVKRGKAKISTADDEAGIRAATRLLEGAVQAATYMIYGMSELDSDKVGMGTTMTAMMSIGAVTVTAQVGDSRIYLIRNGAAQQLTEDHTLINWQLKQGIITREEALHSKHKNVITRAVGNREYVQVDTGIVQMQTDDRFLLCSDGLHGYLELEEIPELVALGGERAVNELIDLANARGGKDNITAVLVEVAPRPVS